MKKQNKINKTHALVAGGIVSLGILFVKNFFGTFKKERKKLETKPPMNYKILEEEIKKEDKYRLDDDIVADLYKDISLDENWKGGEVTEDSIGKTHVVHVSQTIGDEKLYMNFLLEIPLSILDNNDNKKLNILDYTSSFKKLKDHLHEVITERAALPPYSCLEGYFVFEYVDREAEKELNEDTNELEHPVKQVMLKIPREFTEPYSDQRSNGIANFILAMNSKNVSKEFIESRLKYVSRDLEIHHPQLNGTTWEEDDWSIKVCIPMWRISFEIKEPDSELGLTKEKIKNCLEYMTNGEGFKISSTRKSETRIYTDIIFHPYRTIMRDYDLLSYIYRDKKTLEVIGDSYKY